MSTKRDELIAEIKAKLRAAREAEHQKQASAAAHGVEYSEARRSENLRLLRAYFNTTQDRFAELLGVSSQSQYSLFERGQKVLPSVEAREIERGLDLPDRWLDRANAQALFVATGQLAVLKELQRAPADASPLLAKVLNSLTSPTLDQ